MKQRGFTVIETVMALAIVALIGVVAWQAVSKHAKVTATVSTSRVSPTPVATKSTSPSATPSAKPSPSTAPVAATLDVKDLGVKFAPPSSLPGLNYVVVHLLGDQAVNSVSFYTPQTVNAGCSQGSGSVGILTYDSDKGGDGGSGSTKVGSAHGSNLYFVESTDPCSPSEAVFQQLIQALKATLTSD